VAYKIKIDSLGTLFNCGCWGNDSGTGNGGWGCN